MLKFSRSLWAVVVVGAPGLRAGEVDGSGSLSVATLWELRRVPARKRSMGVGRDLRGHSVSWSGGGVNRPECETELREGCAAIVEQ